MGVDQIYEFLKRNPGYYTAADIAKNLNLNVRGVSRCLKSVIKYPEIKYGFFRTKRYEHMTKQMVRSKKTKVYTFKEE